MAVLCHTPAMAASTPMLYAPRQSSATEGHVVHVLVLNCGSSSLKFQLLAMPAEDRLAHGVVERIAGDYAGAVGQALDKAKAAAGRVDAVGHRIVHGGDRFTDPVLIDDAVTAALDALTELAPLHNGPGVAGIRAARAVLDKNIPMVAAFDTAFHVTMPPRAAQYALPHEIAERHHVRRYGFHGLSYRYVTGRYAALAGIPASRATFVGMHLGNGCSVVAVRNGVSIDTSMGFTPLEGLVMGTRAGDLDPAVIGYLARAESVPEAEVERWLNERSGLLGVSGRSGDMRHLLEAEAEDARAALAIDLFCYRARKYAGAYMAALGGAPAIVFTGGIGEHSPEIRRRICADMAWCGLTVDDARNRAAVGTEAVISSDGAAIRALVIPTDEERVIARDVVTCLADVSSRSRP
jgi:acetate kinase